MEPAYEEKIQATLRRMAVDAIILLQSLEGRSAREGELKMARQCRACVEDLGAVLMEVGHHSATPRTQDEAARDLVASVHDSLGLARQALGGRVGAGGVNF